MQMLEIEPYPNGSHDNRTYNGTLPDGWAAIPEDMDCPDFPFGEVEAEEMTYTRDTGVVDEDGNIEVETFTLMTVTKWTAGEMPEPQPMPEPEATQLDRVEAQATYTAMMTDTLLEV